jgi:hypothetical protein
MVENRKGDPDSAAARLANANGRRREARSRRGSDMLDVGSRNEVAGLTFRTAGSFRAIAGFLDHPLDSSRDRRTFFGRACEPRCCAGTK